MTKASERFGWLVVAAVMCSASLGGCGDRSDPGSATPAPSATSVSGPERPTDAADFGRAYAQAMIDGDGEPVIGAWYDWTTFGRRAFGPDFDAIGPSEQERVIALLQEIVSGPLALEPVGSLLANARVGDTTVEELEGGDALVRTRIDLPQPAGASLRIVLRLDPRGESWAIVDAGNGRERTFAEGIAFAYASGAFDSPVTLAEQMAASARDEAEAFVAAWDAHEAASGGSSDMTAIGFDEDEHAAAAFARSFVDALRNGRLAELRSMIDPDAFAVEAFGSERLASLSASERERLTSMLSDVLVAPLISGSSAMTLQRAEYGSYEVEAIDDGYMVQVRARDTVRPSLGDQRLVLQVRRGDRGSHSLVDYSLIGRLSVLPMTRGGALRGEWAADGSGDVLAFLKPMHEAALERLEMALVSDESDLRDQAGEREE